jgi:hypothetical protein
MTFSRLFAPSSWFQGSWSAPWAPGKGSLVAESPEKTISGAERSANYFNLKNPGLLGVVV